MQKTMSYSVNVDYVNYTAINLLEKLGLADPSQHQIDLMESILITVPPTKEGKQPKV